MANKAKIKNQKEIFSSIKTQCWTKNPHIHITGLSSFFFFFCNMSNNQAQEEHIVCEEKYIATTMEEKHLDDVHTVYSDEEKSNEMTPELVAAEKRLVWKLDYLYVMPCIAILNFLQFFDKSALNYSSVLGIKEDTGISSAQFAWLGSIFYLGYLLYQVKNTRHPAYSFFY